MNSNIPKPFLLAAVCVFNLGIVSTLSAQGGSPTPSSSPKPLRPFQLREDAPEDHFLPLGTLLADYSKLIGKKIVPDNTVSPTSGVMPLDFVGLNDQQKAALIEKSLFLNGYTLVDVSDDTVAILGPGKNPRAVGLPLYTKLVELPHNERVFSYLYKLEHRDAIEIAGFLQQLVPPGNDVNFTADPKAHTVIITARTSIMLTVLKVLAALDVTVEMAH